MRKGGSCRVKHTAHRSGGQASPAQAFKTLPCFPEQVTDQLRPLRPQSTERYKERTLGKCCVLQEAACNDSGCLVSLGKTCRSVRHRPLPLLPTQGAHSQSHATVCPPLGWVGARPLSLMGKVTTVLAGHCGQDRSPAPAPQRKTFPVAHLREGGGSAQPHLYSTPLPERAGAGCPLGWS